ncbi:MAG: hypothetical protein WC614_12415 [bacterium]
METEIIEQNGMKLMTEKQKLLIEQLLKSERIEKRYKQFVEKTLQNEVTSYSASKLISFLTSLIGLKKNFVKQRKSNGNSSCRKISKRVSLDKVKSYMENVRSEVGYAVRALDNEAFDAVHKCLEDLHRELWNSEFADMSLR